MVTPIMHWNVLKDGVNKIPKTVQQMRKIRKKEKMGIWQKH